jgi:hypothetical protein
MPGAPTAVGKIFTTRPDSMTANLRSGILTTIRACGPRLAFSCASASAVAINITPVKAASLLDLIFCSEHLPILPTGKEEADRAPAEKLLTLKVL